MKALQSRSRSVAKRAFTLIEIMVATVIMIVLVGLVIEITSEVLKVWNRSSGKMSANAEARIAMELITRDLETAVLLDNGQQWLRVEGPVGPGGAYNDDSNTVSLKLFSPALDYPTTGAIAGPGICAIGYRLQFKESYVGGQNVYALYRRIVDPSTTFQNYLGSRSMANSPQEELVAGWDDASITANENYLVSNIVEFKVLIYLEGGAGDPVNADAENKVDADYVYGGSGGSTERILYADVILTVVSDTGLEMLQVINNIPEEAEDVVREHGQTFTRRVHFLVDPMHKSTTP